MKRAKIPGLARTVEITINMPEAARSAPASVPQPSTPTRWNRAKGVGKVVGASIVALTSIAAIIVSILALSEQKAADREQQQVNAAAEAAGQRQEAEQVSFVQDAGSSTVVPGLSISSEDANESKIPVLIENLGTSPVTDPILGIFVGGSLVPPYVKRPSIIELMTDVQLSDIPACSSATIYLAPAITAAIKYDMVDPLVPSQLPRLTTQQIGQLVPHSFVADLTFSDGNGRWEYLESNTLTQVSNVPGDSEASMMMIIHTTYKPATGCT